MRELLEHDYVPENIGVQLEVKPLWNARLYLERVSVKAVVVRAVVAEFVKAEQPVVKVCAGTAVVAVGKLLFVCLLYTSDAADEL